MKNTARQTMNKQTGFTLIELVVVIVILGILAVTAAPKFINLQDDARTATLQAVKASMQSASSLIYSKSLIAGNEKNASATTEFVYVNTKKTQINYGYPLADYSAAATANTGNWGDLLDIAADFDSVVIGGNYIVYPKGSTAPTATTIGDSSASCYITYTQAASATTPPTYVITPCL
jgi:MSHA pilin protein MshA